MQPPHQHTRINLAELKAQIVKKLGPDGSKQYFLYLNRFLSMKVNKLEFDKLCLKILGRENIQLHNKFIRSILQNACKAKVPPPAVHKADVINQAGVKENGSHANTNKTIGGDILPVSPRKARTALRDRRAMRSALGPNGKTNFINVTLENGDLNGGEILRPHPSVSKPPDGTLARDDGEKESHDKGPVQAPIGLPLGQVNTNLARKSPPQSSSSRNISSSGFLFDSLTLKERMEQIASSQGLEGVSLDCANVLNHGLDLYLKGLIKSCVQLVGAKSGQESIKNNAQEQRTNDTISLQDFRVAMEINPRQLGEDWTLLLEKICTHAFEE